MQEPLLEERRSSRLFSQSTLNLIRQSVVKQVDVKNELPEVAKLPMNLNEDFMDKCVEGV